VYKRQAIDSLPNLMMLTIQLLMVQKMKKI
jgi:hypothetical protein